MPNYNFSVIRSVLSETEKERCLAIFLNTEEGVIDWQKATGDFGAASVDSMKVSYRNIIKKIEKACADPNAPAAAVKTTPAKVTPAKKRKAAAGGEDGETPHSKKRARKPKNKADTPVATDAEDGAEETEKDGVKPEPVEEDV